VTSLPDIQDLLWCLLAGVVVSRHLLEFDLPVAGPGVRDLVASLVLRGAKVKQQLAVRNAALVGVGDGSAIGVAVGARDDRVHDADVGGEAGLEVEVEVRRGRGG
jgi:hypothetical protein